MKVKRIVLNVETSNVTKANDFYHDILGLRIVMLMAITVKRAVVRPPSKWSSEASADSSSPQEPWRNRVVYS